MIGTARRDGRWEVSVAVTARFGEPRSAEQLQDEADEAHEYRHADAESDHGRHVRLEPRTVRLFIAWNKNKQEHSRTLQQLILLRHTWNADAVRQDGFESDRGLVLWSALANLNVAVLFLRADSVPIKVLTRLVVQAGVAQFQRCNNESGDSLRSPSCV